jgi:putative transposase
MSGNSVGHEVGKSYSVRRECLDHLLILQVRQLQRILYAYVDYFNRARPHQGIKQQIPDSAGTSRVTAQAGTKVVAVPILAGLHHDYRRSA